MIIEIDNEKLTTEGTKPLDRAWLKQLIDLGLRAQLVSQSMVTGLLLVQLDFHPDTWLVDSFLKEGRIESKS